MTAGVLLYAAWLPVLVFGVCSWPYIVRELRRERRHP